MTRRASQAKPRVHGVFSPSRTEVALGVVVIAVLSTVAFTSVDNRGEDRRVKATEEAMRTLHTAVARYETLAGERPSDLDVLLRERRAGWPGPALTAETLPVDGWGNPLRYYGKGDTVRFRSAGPDQVYHTADDLTG